MSKRLGMLLMISAAAIMPAAAQDAKSFLQTADKAIGASGVKSVAYAGTGTIRYVGQSFDPNGDWPRAPLTSYTNTIDYGSKSSKEEYAVDLTKKEQRGGGLAVPRAANFVSGGYAWALNAQGQANPQPGEAELREFLITISPYGFIKAALASNDATLEERYFNRLDKTIKVVGFSVGKYWISGEFDDNNLLDRVVTTFPTPVQGDTAIEFRYTDWKDVGGGAKFPFHIHAHQGDHPLEPNGRNWFDVRVTDAKVNADAAITVPDNVRSAAATPVRVASQKLADGVWFIGGGSHNSLAVEFKDFVTVIEGPLNDARSNAVIAETHKLIPNKPIRYLVNTHHHWDHSGGIRAFVAEGATVITDERNKEYYQNVVLAPQPRTLEPDRLSRFPFAKTGPGTLALQTFADRYSIGDGTRTIELYHVDGLDHANDVLIAYLPQSKILVNADLYSPPPQGGNLANVNANAVALFKNVKRLKLDVAQHVPIHGNPGGNADFDRIVGPVAAKAPAQGDGG
jgi:glyoxylase-like metal-dependent hydrolase (beta-lactamase superfamily II)